MTQRGGTEPVDPKDLRRQLAQMSAAGAYLDVLKLLDAQGDQLPKGLVGFHRANALIAQGRPIEALGVLDVLDAGQDKPVHWRMRFFCYLALDRFDEAGALADAQDLPKERRRNMAVRVSRAAFAKGEWRVAADWGLRARMADEGTPFPFSFLTDLSALLLLGDVQGVRDRLSFCGTLPFRRLGEALHDATDVLLASAGRGRPPDLTLFDPALDLAKDLADIWDVNAGSNRRLPVPQELQDLIWSRLAAKRSGARHPVSEPLRPIREFELVADWLGIPANERPSWRESLAAAQHANRELKVDLLGSVEARERIARTLPPVDWSGVRSALAEGSAVILTSSHASLAFAMPLEFQRAGMDVRIIASRRSFVSVPEYDAMHYTDLDTQNPRRMSRRLIENLRSGSCVFLAADGQVGATSNRYPELGVQARLPGNLWAVAKRYGARIFWMDTSWADGRISTSLSPMPSPQGVTDPAKLQDHWCREVLNRLRTAWARDVRNIHMNLVIEKVI